MKHNLDFIVYDLETGGFSPKKNPIVELGFVVLNWDLEKVEEYHSIIKCPYAGKWDTVDGQPELSPEALKVNGLTKELIAKGNDAEVVIKDMVRIFSASKKRTDKKPALVGQNILKFDNPYLDDFLSRYNKKLSSYVELGASFDTMWMGRFKHKESTDYTLGTLCLNEGIEVNNAHTAMGDIYATTELFITFMKGLRGEGVKEVKKEKRFRESFKF